MRKSFALAALILLVSVPAEARRLYGMAGCGLGHLIVGKQNQILVAFTNFSGSNQVFAVTSGTSDCPVHDMRVENRLPSFVEPNEIQLANDIARGEGETLAGLSEILGCKEEAPLASKLQQNYMEIFDGKPEGLSDRILETVRDDAVLKESCQAG